MILMKSKQNFWSQLLLSMIAMFALPVAAQGLENHALGGETCPNEQRQVPQQVVNLIVLAKKTQQESGKQPLLPVKQDILFKKEPHFNTSILHDIAPIRAGPLMS
ncbi:Protein of uncharacterised function (DUF2547) [[Pasteurella] aerogenes]|nr:Protein of uncharacterised function (DUF2547) [[Pasteurella] aerogenes]